MSMKRNLGFGILAAAFALGAENLPFDAQLTGWRLMPKQAVALDRNVKQSETGSLRLTAKLDQKMKLKNKKTHFVDVRKEFELEPDRKYVVTVMAKGENLSDNRTGMFFNTGKKWDRGARWLDSFDWTKFTCELDTGKMGGSKVTLHFTLYGKEGQLWIDQLTITPKEEN